VVSTFLIWQVPAVHQRSGLSALARNSSLKKLDLQAGGHSRSLKKIAI
jgi:hypothetical protein